MKSTLVFWVWLGGLVWLNNQPLTQGLDIDVTVLASITFMLAILSDLRDAFGKRKK